METIYGKVTNNSVKKDSKVVDNKTYGVGYPFSSNRGYFSKSTGVTLVRNNLLQLLKTVRGERVMLPNYGMNLKNFLFEPLDKQTFNAIQVEIFTSITNYLPQLELTNLSVVSNEEVNLNGVPGLVVNLACSIKDLDNQFIEVNLDIV